MGRRRRDQQSLIRKWDTTQGERPCSNAGCVLGPADKLLWLWVGMPVIKKTSHRHLTISHQYLFVSIHIYSYLFNSFVHSFILWLPAARALKAMVWPIPLDHIRHGGADSYLYRFIHIYSHMFPSIHILSYSVNSFQIYLSLFIRLHMFS